MEFKPERSCGNNILRITDLNKSIDGEEIFKDLTFTVDGGDKIVFIGFNNNYKTVLFDIISGELEPDSGTYEWGVTITYNYMPRNNADFFTGNSNLVDWLRQYSKEEKDEAFIRGFLGRMLFSGDDALKMTDVLSGGEKVRCMLARSMLSGANVLILDEPTNHLDLEAITALNDGMSKYPDVILFGSHDHELNNSVANRIIEFTPKGIIDRKMTFDEYFSDQNIKEIRDKMYDGHQRPVL